MKLTLHALMLSLLLASCYNSAFDEEIFRTQSDPFPDVPEAESLTRECTVFLSWLRDEGSDEFYLMKSPDTSPPCFSCIYRGRGTEYTDTDVNDGSRYIYRLDKRRGKKYFEGARYAYGWGSECRKDFYEGNDRIEDATFLEHDLICNIPCVRFVTGGKDLTDSDWFYISVPPRRAAEIVISQKGLTNDTAGSLTKLRIQTLGCESVPVRQKVAHVINNTSYETKKFYFKVYPEPTGLFAAGSSTALIEYTVSLSKIYNYSL